MTLRALLHRPTAVGLAVALLVSAVLAVAGPGVQPAAAQTAPALTATEQWIARDVHAFINDERAARGLPALPWDDRLAERAAAWSAEMAATGDFRHSSSDFRAPADQGWTGSGENIYYGGGPYGTAGSSNSSFMRSAGHRSNILQSGFHAVGVGAVCRDGVLWVTHVFGIHESQAFTGLAGTPPQDPIVHDDRGEGTACGDSPADPAPSPSPVFGQAPAAEVPGGVGGDVPGPSPESVGRIAGPDRFATAVAAVDPDAATLVIASGADWPDAVAAGPVAGRDGTVVLVEPDRLPTATALALDGMSPDRVLVMGGTTAISPQVVDAVLDRLGGRPDVTRLAGATRIQTATEAAAALEGWSSVVIADADAVFDALNAAATGIGPVLLTGPDGLDTATLALLADRGAQVAHVVGAATGSPAVGQLQDLGVQVTSWAPVEADQMSQALSRLVDGSPDAVLVASAVSWPDTLTAAALAIRTGTPLLLARPDGSTDFAAVADLAPAVVQIVGGTSALPDSAVPTALGGTR